MRKASRIVLPILLSLAIILCLAWYLMVYDRDFTRDILLNGARHFESQGKHETAAWFYDLAYKQAANNDSIAIELAEQHVAAGNYTKAEFVLNNAIADGGGAELYIALSKIYVAQDKLLDAVKMLDAVCRDDSTVNDSVKQQLIQLRPAAPAAVPAPGMYTQYISVSLSHEDGTLYVSTTKEYPSVSTDVHSGSVTLTSGENTIYALVVSENGLVSPLSIFGYTVGGVIEEVNFADAAIEAKVRQLLNITDGRTLMTNDLWNIMKFTVPAEAVTYADLRHMAYLKELYIADGVSNQLNSIKSLTKLENLCISNTPVSSHELESICSLPSLKELTLYGCGLSTVEGIENAKNLTYLDLSENTLRDITPISNLSGLKELYLQGNALEDLTALSGLMELSVLNVSHNSLTDLSTLGSNAQLTVLNADANMLQQLGGIERLTGLKKLSLAQNKLTDISALKACTALEELNISGNSLADISIIAEIIQLTTLDFSYNQVAKLPSFSKDAALVKINGSNNQLRSLEALKGLSRLNAVNMDYNKYISSVNALAECPVIVVVSVYGTNVKDVSKLRDLGVVVYYTPT